MKEHNRLPLNNISLFQSIPTQVEEEIINVSIIKNFRSKKIIFEKNEPLKYLHFILKGTIHILKDDSEGKEQIVSILRYGDFFPHVGLFKNNSLTPGIAIATEDTEILLVPLTYFQDLAVKYPDILIEYSKVLSQKIIELQSRLEEKAFYNIKGQIINRLLYLSTHYGESYTDHLVKLNISLTHEELAHLVGTSRETVSRTITNLKKAKAIDSSQSKWIINKKILKQELEE